MCHGNSPAVIEWLDKKAGILHSDVSWKNIMYRRIGGKVYGVLNDFDLARKKGCTKPSSRQRTGTRPYMSIDSLEVKPEEFQPRARHDFESLYYVLLITLTHYQLVGECQADNSKRHKCIQHIREGEPQFATWFQTSNDKGLARDKRGHFIGALSSSSVTTSFSDLTTWIDDLQEIFKFGIIWKNSTLKPGSKKPSEHDLETLNNNITLSNFVKGGIYGAVEIRATDLGDVVKK
jgi:hypothetical protein